MTKPKISLKSVREDVRYLRLLGRDFPTVSSVTTEIINLEAILHLPKPTEHFLADLHGENEAFRHVLRNASGNIKRKVNELFGNTLREQEKKDLCTLIYYPEQKLVGRFVRLAFVRSGYVNVNEGKTYNIGNNGNGWSRTSSAGAAYYLSFNPTDVNPLNNWVRWIGLPLR